MQTNRREHMPLVTSAGGFISLKTLKMNSTKDKEMSRNLE